MRVVADNLPPDIKLRFGNQKVRVTVRAVIEGDIHTVVVSVNQHPVPGVGGTVSVSVLFQIINPDNGNLFARFCFLRSSGMFKKLYSGTFKHSTFPINCH